MMNTIKFTEEEIAHLKLVLDEDVKKRMKAIRDAHNSSYYDDRNLGNRIERYNFSLNLYNKVVEESKPIEQAQAETPSPQPNDMFRIE